jgi:dienelactone hydrolase
MTAIRHRCATARIMLLTCGLVAVGVAAAPAGAAPERNTDSIAVTAPGAASAGAGLSIPRPTGNHLVGVRSTFVLDPARTEPRTGSPRAIPTRVWYPAKHRAGPPGPYFPAPVQAVIETAFGLPSGLFDVDTHATVDAPARRHVRGVLLYMGGSGTPAALYTGQVGELASRGYAVVAFDHPHDTFVVEQPDGSLIEQDVTDSAAAFEARLLDVDVVLDALADLLPQARRQTAIGILGHSTGGAAAGEAMLVHQDLRAGVNLDGFIPGGSFLPSGRLLSEGLDRPFGLMLSLDVAPDERPEIETFLSNMRAAHPVRTLDIHHYGFSDFVVFNPQAEQADPELGARLENFFATGTRDSLQAGQHALMQQRSFLVDFFDQYLKSKGGSGGPHRRGHPAR